MISFIIVMLFAVLMILHSVLVYIYQPSAIRLLLKVIECGNELTWRDPAKGDGFITLWTKSNPRIEIRVHETNVYSNDKQISYRATKVRKALRKAYPVEMAVYDEKYKEYQMMLSGEGDRKRLQEIAQACSHGETDITASS